jgi:hypothetical protein
MSLKIHFYKDGRAGIARKFRRIMEAASRFELEMKVLQTSALPLGYAAYRIKRAFSMMKSPEEIGARDGT